MEKVNVEVIEAMEVEAIVELVNGLIDVIESKKDGRKGEVLRILKERKLVSIKAIAKELDISCKNVSSQLSYLRSEGYNICTDTKGNKFLFEMD